jgi:hypothetical protein
LLILVYFLMGCIRQPEAFLLVAGLAGVAWTVAASELWIAGLQGIARQHWEGIVKQHPLRAQCRAVEPGTFGSAAATKQEIEHANLRTEAELTSKASFLQRCSVSHGNTRAAPSHGSNSAFATHNW